MFLERNLRAKMTVSVYILICWLKFWGLICALNLNLYQGIWYVVAMLLGHGVKQQWFMRPSFRGKVTVMATWLFLATFLVLAYTNIFFSLLVTTTYEKPIDTVEDLLNHQAYSFTDCT